MHGDFKNIFGSMCDPRVERTKKHALVDIVAIAIIGVMAGAQSFEEMEDFGNIHEQWLKKYFALENGIPSHDTINRVFKSLNPSEFQTSFLKWTQSIKELLPESIVPIDGKTLRGSHQRSKGIKGLHVVSAWSHANGLSLGQIKVNDKTNEITAIPELIKQLALEGAIVTIDAMGCQREIAAALVAQKADYVLGVKGNQGNLHESIRDCFKLKDVDIARYAAKDEIACEHGRIERREVEILDANILKGLVDISQWGGLHSIVKMTYINETKAAEVSTEHRYYISSVEPSDPSKILRAIRAHWGIESMHWSLDVTFKEDSCRVRNHNSALNLNCLRKMSLSFLKSENTFKASIRRKQLKLWSTPDYALKVFAKI